MVEGDSLKIELYTENWYALALWVDGDVGEGKSEGKGEGRSRGNGITSEVALMRMGIREKRVDKGCGVLDEGARDVRHMIRLKG